MNSLFTTAIVILLSFDGLKPSHVTPETAPHLYQIAQQGMSAEFMEPSFPASTFINHTSIMTGCTPEQHGIVSNFFIDPKRGDYLMDNDASWLECEPLWAAAARQGIKTAVYAWPVANGSWNGIKPHYQMETPVDKKKRQKFFQRFDTEKEWNHISQWLELPVEQRPRLILGYFPDVDGAGHRFGPEAPKTLAIVQEHDRQFGKFLRKIRKLNIYPRLHFVIVSDHGMALGTKPVFSDKILVGLGQAMGKRKWREKHSSGSFINFYFDSTRDATIAANYLKRFPVLNVYLADHFPKHWHYQNPRGGDLVVTLDPPYFFTESSAKKTSLGFHGYDPKHSEMKAFFAASGPAFPKKRLQKIQNTEVAPMIAKILGLR